MDERAGPDRFLPVQKEGDTKNHDSVYMYKGTKYSCDRVFPIPVRSCLFFSLRIECAANTAISYGVRATGPEAQSFFPTVRTPSFYETIGVGEDAIILNCLINCAAAYLLG